MTKSTEIITDKKYTRILEGLLLLEQWILKLLDQGIDVLQKDENRILDISTRLVDAGIPGIARRLRIIPDKIKTGLEWRNYVLGELAECYLFCQSIKKNNAILDPDHQQFIGIVKRKSEIEELNLSIQDQWIFVGTVRTKEENIVVIRNWFYGLSSCTFTLYIEYIVNRFTKPRFFEWGNVYVGKVYFYPSSCPQRVVSIPTAYSRIPTGYELGAESVVEFLNRKCQLLIKIPWYKSFTTILHSTRVIKKDKEYYILDHNDNGLVLDLKEDENYWKLSALIMDKESKIIGEFEDGRLKILSVYNNACLIKI